MQGWLSSLLIFRLGVLVATLSSGRTLANLVVSGGGGNNTFEIVHIGTPNPPRAQRQRKRKGLSPPPFLVAFWAGRGRLESKNRPGPDFDAFRAKAEG